MASDRSKRKASDSLEEEYFPTNSKTARRRKQTMPSATRSSARIAARATRPDNPSHSAPIIYNDDFLGIGSGNGAAANVTDFNAHLHPDTSRYAEVFGGMNQGLSSQAQGGIYGANHSFDIATTTNVIGNGNGQTAYYNAPLPHMGEVTSNGMTGGRVGGAWMMNDGSEHATHTGSGDASFAAPQHPQGTAKTNYVHSYNRAALCDSVDYFKSHEGGNYHFNKTTLGLLIDSHGSIRDYIDGTVVITNLGGEKKRDSTTAKMTHGESQTKESKYFQFLTNTVSLGHAVVIILGDRNPRSPIKPAFPYSVMGHFMVTDIWSEASLDHQNNKVAFWMVRLEKIPTAQMSWWVSGTGDDSHLYAVGQNVCPSFICSECGNTSKMIYNEGWTCLKPECPNHFQFTVDIGYGQQQSMVLGKVHYSTTFLRERKDPSLLIRHPLAPLVPALPTRADAAFGTEKDFKKGIVCPQCLCASRRVRWCRWECEEPTCDFTYSVDFNIYSIDEVRRETKMAKKAKPMNKAIEISNIVQEWTTTIAGYEVDTYALPGEDGTVVGTVSVLHATEGICAKLHGPDDMYINLQQRDLKLQRKTARLHGNRGEELTSHFASNWGAPYKFGVMVDTTGFDEAPEEILRGVSQLTWAQGQIINAIDQKIQDDSIQYAATSMSLRSEPFNELLSLGYFEDCVINYHDDGERELGPTVASLSLGSPSVMRFRPKKRNSIGHTPKTLDDKSKNKPAVLSFPLYHGDICIMHGTDVHRLYEHEVKPNGMLRYAMTSRYIRPETINDEAVRADALIKGKLPAGIEALAYKGQDETGDLNDMNAEVSSVEAPGTLVMDSSTVQRGQADERADNDVSNDSGDIPNADDRTQADADASVPTQLSQGSSISQATALLDDLCLDAEYLSRLSPQQKRTLGNRLIRMGLTCHEAIEEN
ncbi:uncharacterized protein JN550_003207 [Neoarthrinium moseri]|uniref:uncharacterized protein n=1 Tax=Neoarthrinium moseri TaxID=1658444 RepID=UPI001FDB1ABA|nr:uncharacterized protein JN550_003207 [Neoarthrinium moseri]KAI1873938.1 hypothetical protein JN550_003207 [Neoarthrinium moseri]